MNQPVKKQSQLNIMRKDIMPKEFLPPCIRHVKDLLAA